jgi:hypothetical protein
VGADSRKTKCMGQQSNKVQKRKRRENYNKRQKAAAKIAPKK